MLYKLRALREQLIGITVEVEGEDALFDLIDYLSGKLDINNAAVKNIEVLHTYPEIYGVLIDDAEGSRNQEGH